MGIAVAQWRIRQQQEVAEQLHLLWNMQSIILRNNSLHNEPLEVVFLPQVGMNMISFKKGDIEVIDHSTQPEFEERRSGLGPLIGPHFHRRRTAVVPLVKDEALFPHIARVKARGILDPFSHGIARYAPWTATFSDTRVAATLSGKNQWEGVPLSELEGQDFEMSYVAELLPTGLSIELSIVSSTDSVIGIHYYYNLPDGTGKVISRVKSDYVDSGQRKPLDPAWLKNSQIMEFDLSRGANYTFFPDENCCKGDIVLQTATYTLATNYESPSAENCWQLYHPAGASFVCIEPLSAQDPHHPNLSVSSLKINLSIH